MCGTLLETLYKSDTRILGKFFGKGRLDLLEDEYAVWLGLGAQIPFHSLQIAKLHGMSGEDAGTWLALESDSSIHVTIQGPLEQTIPDAYRQFFAERLNGGFSPQWTRHPMRSERQTP